MERAVQRGLERRKAEPVSQMGVDEKAFRKGHSYLTLANDLIRGRVLYVAEDRKQSSLDGFWETLTAEQISGIEAVAMDMWDPYIASVREHVPGADGKIVFDKFHVAQHLGDAVDKVRRKENKTLRVAGDDRLAGTRYDWLRNPASMEPQDRKDFAELRSSELKTARAWALKETAMALYSYVYERPARKHCRWWHNWAVRSRLQPMIEVARMLKRRFENIITYLRHRITNATSESINAKIQWVKYTARGFRNKQNFVHAIYFTAAASTWPRKPLNSRKRLIFNRVVTAGTVACCSRAICWRNAVIRASRNARSNSGSFCQRCRVLGEIPTDSAASS